MPWLPAKPINLSENQRRILEQLANGTHTRLHLIKRSKIILMAESGATNNDIEKRFSITNRMVIKWRNRFYEAAEQLAKVESETPHKLKESIINVLSDNQRPGKPSHFTDEQVATIIAISLQEPQTLGFPYTHWTNSLLADAVVEKGIVESISVSQIRRFLKRKRY